jgi:undecaprenyl-diphosphatase
MLAVPTMLAASVLDLYKSHSAIAENVPALGVGFVVSFITAIIAIKSFLNFLKKRDFTFFGWYRIALAVVYFFLFIK